MLGNTAEDLHSILKTIKEKTVHPCLFWPFLCFRITCRDLLTYMADLTRSHLTPMQSDGWRALMITYSAKARLVNTDRRGKRGCTFIRSELKSIFRLFTGFKGSSSAVSPS